MRRMLAADNALDSNGRTMCSADRDRLNALITRIEKLGRHVSRSTDTARAERWLAKALEVLVSAKQFNCCDSC